MPKFTGTEKLIPGAPPANIREPVRRHRKMTRRRDYEIRAFMIPKMLQKCRLCKNSYCQRLLLKNDCKRQLQLYDKLKLQTLRLQGVVYLMAKVGANHYAGGSHSGSESDALHDELWRACAGPLVILPREGERVYYFLQGHMEQIEASTPEGVNHHLPFPSFPSKILCRVMQVKLRAEPSDEVYADITLAREKDQREIIEPDPPLPEPQKSNINVCWKPLTVSDTHGSLYVVKRIAEDCFPALDKSQQSPWQDLVATDLQGNEWHFRHIFRGQPRRHVLTMGWSDFLTVKKLVAGDILIFLRGENGELRVGVRRLGRQPIKRPSYLISSQSLSYAIKSCSTFPVCYRPSTSWSEFVVSVNKYLQARNLQLTVGTRFRKKFEGGRRCSGTIVGVGDNPSSIRPHSEWRSLKVQWDKPADISRPNWVSPWEIEPLVEDTTPNPQTSQRNEQASPPALLSPWEIEPLVEDTTPNPQTSQRNEQASPSALLSPMQHLSIPESFTATEAKNLSRSEKNHLPPVSTESVWSNQLDVVMESTAPVTEQGQCNGIRLFGVELFDHSTSKKTSIGMSEADQPLSKSCIEVYMEGLGGAVDLASLNSYTDLLNKLKEMFEVEGELHFGSATKWEVLYQDHENDLMILGDNQWHEFRDVVRRIFIYPKGVMTSLADSWYKKHHVPDAHSSNVRSGH